MSRWFYKGTKPTSLTVGGVIVPVAPKSYVSAPRAALHEPSLFTFVSDDADDAPATQPVEPSVSMSAEVAPSATPFRAVAEPTPDAEPDVPSPASTDVVSSPQSPDDTEQGPGESDEHQVIAEVQSPGTDTREAARKRRR